MSDLLLLLLYYILGWQIVELDTELEVELVLTPPLLVAFINKQPY